MPHSCALRFLSDDVLEVRVAPGGALPAPFSLALDPDRAWEGPSALEETGDSSVRVLRTPALTARFDSTTGRLRVQTADGEVLLDDTEAPSRVAGRTRLAKCLRPGEALYGLGDRPVGLDRRGHRFALWNTDAYRFQRGTDPLYKTFPFVLGLADGGTGPLCYGLFVDTFAPSTFDLGAASEDVLAIEAEEEALTYYVLYAPSPLGVLERYAQLTGRTPMLPRWALGYHQSRYSYRTEEEVREVARGFRERGIPCDTLYFDIHYMDRYRVFTWNPAAFPDPAGLIADLRADGFTTVAIVDPGVKTAEEDYPPLQEGLARDLFVKDADGRPYEGVVWPGRCHFPDFFREDVRAWWGALHRGLLDCGVDGVWCDMNEPAVFTEQMMDPPREPDEVPARARTMPDDNLHTLDGRPVAHRRVHNAYGMQMLRAAYEGLRRLCPDRRPFTITRAAYAGAQRYGTTWTGDNSATWDHLRLAAEQCLSLGVGGMPFCGADVGGFSEEPTGELLARWTELGAVTPLFRNHTAVDTPPQEPWCFGPEAEAACTEAIRLRYGLVPYLYTTLEEMSRTGVPLLRPLPLVHPADPAPRAPGAPLGFYVGEALLAYPVLEAGARHVEAYLPEVPGGWYDFHTGARLPGGQQHHVDAPLGRLPLFVRAGTVLPIGPDVQTTAELADQPLMLRVYPGEGESASVLYEDAGDGWAHEEGQYYRCTFRITSSEGFVQVTPDEDGKYRPRWGEWNVEVVGARNTATAERRGQRLAVRLQRGAVRFSVGVGEPFTVAW